MVGIPFVLVSRSRTYASSTPAEYKLINSLRQSQPRARRRFRAGHQLRLHRFYWIKLVECMEFRSVLPPVSDLPTRYTYSRRGEWWNQVGGARDRLLSCAWASCCPRRYWQQPSPSQSAHVTRDARVLIAIKKTLYTALVHGPPGVAWWRGVAALGYALQPRIISFITHTLYCKLMLCEKMFAVDWQGTQLLGDRYIHETMCSLFRYPLLYIGYFLKPRLTHEMRKRGCSEGRVGAA